MTDIFWEGHQQGGGIPIPGVSGLESLGRAPCLQGTVKETEFVPARGLEGPHRQTLWAAYRRPVPSLPLQVETFPTRDGDLVRLAWPRDAHPIPHPLVFLLHGLNGSRRSRYIRGMIHALHQAGYVPFVIEFRGVDRGPMRTRRSYHAAFTDDLDLLVRHFLEQPAARPLAAIGFSLGGSVLLNWLANCSMLAPLRWAAAVSVPYDIAACSHALDHGNGRLYRSVLLRELRRTAARRARAYGHPTLTAREILGIKSFRDFDHRYVAPLFGYRDADDYYARASCRHRLRGILVPTTLIAADDDPLIPPETLPTAEDLASRMVLLRTRHGGHVGFIEDDEEGRRRRAWTERILLEELERRMPPPPPHQVESSLISTWRRW